MIVDGKLLAQSLLDILKADVGALQKKGITPTLAVILIGDDPASLAYIKQKQKAAEAIGARVLFDHQPPALTAGGLYNLITKYNKDTAVHGLIVQRPIPKEVGVVNDTLDDVLPSKDVDGFLPGSPFEVPVAMAVGEILRTIYTAQFPVNDTTPQHHKEFTGWLKDKHIVVIGRGQTAGTPIFHFLQKRETKVTQIHSQTPDPETHIKKADIVISCVGRERIVARESVKPGAILISVGLWRDSEGKLRGDYEEVDISDVAGWYTPTPGGVGPVNVACLMQNLIKACKMK
ncbi:bifunctional 5,10-methylenetetrahydrofolate dehydrogenase/5,10-methenyltetrahydrofolate cyclohydrolase [Patescibacteria group bacterium]|nr:bifunctional 5,10-methylenetetrahydrofolate dehydrogenase/5,10-methenyltetrahydrofolate cyclohydrolase [Patescibacteria group bacterium]